MTVKRLEKIAWGRSGRAVSGGDRKTLLAVMRKARRQGRVREREPDKEPSAK